MGDFLLQFFGTVALITLTILTIILSQYKNKALFAVTGQVVFRWLAITLVTIIIVRLIGLANLLQIEETRPITSVVFIVSVAGIVYTVVTHMKKDKDKWR